MVRGGPRWVLGVLLGINLLNYMDRQVLYAILPLIQADFRASDVQMGALASAFMVVYMCAAPPIGWLADRSSRKNWIAFGVLSWSAATMLSGLASTYRRLFAARAAVGVGESCYGSVSPSFVAEHFPENRRAWALALFSMAIPVGSALGYIAGGVIGQRWGWRSAFFLAGLPGLVLALVAYGLKDPPRVGEEARPATAAQYLALLRNPTYVLCTLAMTAMTFGLGAYVVWMPTFFTRAWGMSVSRAGGLFGALTVVAGILGSLAGGWMADRARRVTSKAYLLVSGIGLVAAFPLACWAVLATRLSAAVTAVLLAEFCAFLNMGPLNAVIVSVTKTRVRSMAFALNIFILHALGDAVSPTAVGAISDRAGLRPALVFAAAFLGLAGAFCFWGTRRFDLDAALAGA